MDVLATKGMMISGMKKRPNVSTMDDIYNCDDGKTVEFAISMVVSCFRMYFNCLHNVQTLHY